MRVVNKKTIVGATVGAVVVAGVSVLSGIYLSPTAGVIIGLLVSTTGFLAANLNYLIELKSDVTQRLVCLDEEFTNIKATLAKEPPFPFDVKYLQLQGRNCALFKHAALREYKRATA